MPRGHHGDRVNGVLLLNKGEGASSNRELQTARRLLDETDLPVAEVAARVGMVDVAYFSRLFKKKYGLSPLRYRARPAEG